MSGNKNYVLSCKRVYNAKTKSWTFVVVDKMPTFGLSEKDKRIFKSYPQYLMDNIIGLFDE
jgi:hypothetical protein